jgi:hypothetical protein
MAIPTGFEKLLKKKYKRIDALLPKLTIAIYGLVQDAGQWWKKFHFVVLSSSIYQVVQILGFLLGSIILET